MATMDTGSKLPCLDDAQDAFNEHRTVETAQSLLATGRDYWADEAISDETFDLECLQPVIRYLSQLRRQINELKYGE